MFFFFPFAIENPFELRGTFAYFSLSKEEQMTL